VTTATKVLMLGANGQLGREFQRSVPLDWDLLPLSRDQADLSDPMQCQRQVQDVCKRFQPDIVLNAAAYTAVDRAETDRAIALQVNGVSAGVLRQLAQEHDAVLVHFSTDYVFDGAGTQPWTEADVPAPQSVYGQTKFLGERAIQQEPCKHLIFRTSWVFGAQGNNFLKTMLRLAAERDALRVVADQITQQVLRQIATADLHDARWGVYHAAPKGETSWHGYAQHVIQGALQRGAALKLGPHQVLPIPTADYPLPAPRPHNSRLNTDKLRQTFDLDLPSWQQGVDEVLHELLGPFPA
jgi:dTDP-4-dehydrorhamnose reductase